MTSCDKRVIPEWVIWVYRVAPRAKACWKEWGSEFTFEAAEDQKWQLEDEIGYGNVQIQKVWTEADAEGNPLPNGLRLRELLP